MSILLVVKSGGVDARSEAALCVEVVLGLELEVALYLYF